MILNLRNKRGIVLIAVYFVIVVLLAFSVIFVNRTITEKNLALREKDLVNAFYLAEAGLDRGLAWLRSQAPPLGTAAFDPLCGNQACGQPACEQALGNGTYSVCIDPNDSNTNANSIKRYKIISSGRIGGDITKQLDNEVQTDSYARYGFFSDSESFKGFGYKFRVWLATGDVFSGPAQTNGIFNIFRKPVFNGLVKTADDVLKFYNNGNPKYGNPYQIKNWPHDIPVFQQGIEFEAELIPKVSKNYPNLQNGATQSGFKLSGPTTVVLNADGTMNVTNASKGWNNENMALPANGALFVEGGDLTVSGTLDGRLSMGTNRDIIVNNNITYADDPRVNPNSDDVLALIARNYVMVSPDAPNNVEINASIMALTGSFLVKKWWQGGPKGELTIYGSTTEANRGPVGTLNMTTGAVVSGYLRDFNFDTRLITAPPPFYPTTGDYVSLSWKE